MEARRWCSLLLLLCIALCLLSQLGARAEDQTQPPAQPDFNKMRVKQLKAILTERGFSAAYSEKTELIAKVREVYNLPIKEQPKAKSDEAAGSQGKQESIEELMAKLKGMPGMENMKMFTGDDLKRFQKDL